MNPPVKNTGKPKTKNLSEDSIPSFIRKTFEILEEGKYADVIRWSDDGTAILINNPTEFAQKVLPVYFKHNNLTSFIRQLNMYDFHKKRSLNTGVDHVYCHELFQRGKRHLLKEIRRKNSESTAPPSEKTLPAPETPQTRQDLAAVVHENVLLKKYNRETLGRVTLLETKIKEVSVENQTLWGQIYQLKEKESLMKSVIANIIKQSGFPLSSLPPFLQNELDFTTLNLKNSQDQKDNSPAFTAQTTTKMFYPTSNLAFSTAYNGAQQDLSKDMRVNPVQIIQQEYPMGAIQPMYHLENFAQAKPNDQQGQLGMGENKFHAFNFELNRPIQGLENWNFSFDNNIRPLLQTENDRLNQLRYEENAESAKRKMIGQGNSKEEMDSYTKKIKQNPLGVSDVNSRQKLANKGEVNSQNIFTNTANVIKSEGGHKENL